MNAGDTHALTSGGSDWQPVLETALSDEDIAASHEAGAALLQMTAARAAIAAALQHALQHAADPFRRRRASVLLCELNGQLTGDTADDAPGDAASEMVEAAISAQLSALDDPSWLVREPAVAALVAGLHHRCVSSSSAGKVRAALLRTALREKNTLVRSTAVQACAALSGTKLSLHAELTAAARTGKPNLRRRAVAALSAHPASDAFVQTLCELLQDSHHKIRRTAALALSPLGSAARPAVPALVRRSFDNDEAVAAAACGAISQLAEQFEEPLASCLRQVSARRGSGSELLESLLATATPAQRTALHDLRDRRTHWLKLHKGDDATPAAAWLIGQLLELQRA